MNNFNELPRAEVEQRVYNFLASRPFETFSYNAIAKNCNISFSGDTLSAGLFNNMLKELTSTSDWLVSLKIKPKPLDDPKPYETKPIHQQTLKAGIFDAIMCGDNDDDIDKRPASRTRTHYVYKYSRLRKVYDAAPTEQKRINTVKSAIMFIVKYYPGVNKSQIFQLIRRHFIKMSDSVTTSAMNSILEDGLVTVKIGDHNAHCYYPAETP